jgi:hypothetical protein
MLYYEDKEKAERVRRFQKGVGKFVAMFFVIVPSIILLPALLIHIWGDTSEDFGSNVVFVFFIVLVLWLAFYGYKCLPILLDLIPPKSYALIGPKWFKRFKRFMQFFWLFMVLFTVLVNYEKLG